MSPKHARQERSRRGWLTLAGAVVLVGLAGAQAAVADPSPGDEDDGQHLSAAEIESILDQTVNDPLVNATAALEAAGVGGVKNEFTEVFAGIEVVNAGDQLQVYYNANANNPVLEDFLTRVQTVAAVADLKVLPVPVTFDPQLRADLAREISANSEEWAKRLGVSSVSSVSFDTVSGQISILTPDSHSARGFESLEVEGIPVSVVVDGEAKVVPQNRSVDAAPWTGGSRLKYLGSTNATDCTMGFNWRKWGTTEAMGSTANHCFSLTGFSNWYNSGSYCWPAILF